MKNMKRILFILLYTIPFVGFGQNDLPIVPENLGDYYNISNHSKSLTNFGFRVPHGFNEYRDGGDNSVIKIFRKTDYSKRKDVSGNIVNNSITEFGVTVIKYRDFPKYQKFLSMSNSELKEQTTNNLIGRDKSIDPNEIIVLYEKNDLFWVIMGSWSEEKNLYLILAHLFGQKQIIQLSFMTTIKGNKEEDVKRMKKLINSFKYL